MPNEAGSARPSPFKFLDPYGPEDGNLFFGRNAEVAELYAKLYSAAVTVIYGESGTGKTSLIHCGLRNRIPLEDMLFVSVRTAGEPDAALRQALLRAAPQLQDGGEDLSDLLRRVIRRSYKTVLLVFDQFEEFLLFQPEDTRRRFAAQLAGWLDEGLNLRLLFAIRQEYLAPLTALEPDLPGLYDNRLWLRRMSREQAEEVITGPCATAGVDIAPALVQSLLDALSSNGQGIDLPTLQVVLDSLYRQAVASSDTAPVLSYEDYQALGQIHSILARFLDERIAVLGEQGERAKQVLKTLVTAEATRRPATQDDIGHRLARDFRVELPAAERISLLETLVQERVLREDPDRHCYELRHDSLAPHVRGWMSVLEQEMEALRESLEHRFREYQRNQRLLDAPFLSDLAPYEGRFLLEGQLAAFVQSSKDVLCREETRRREQEVSRQRQRRRIVAVVAGGFFLVIAGFGGFSYLQWQEADVQRSEAQRQQHRAEEQKAEAERQTQLAEKQKEEADRQKQQAELSFHKAWQAVDEFFTQVSENKLLNAPGMETLRRDLLEKAQKYYAEFSQQRTDDAQMGVELADAVFRVARIRGLLGERTGTEAAYRRCIALYEELAQEHSDAAEILNGLANSHLNLGVLQRDTGHLAEAQVSYREAIDIEERLVREHTQEPKYALVLNMIYGNLGKLQRDGGDLVGARDSYRKAVDAGVSLVNEHPEVPEYRSTLAWTFNKLGILQKDGGDPIGARESYQKAIDIYEQLVKERLDMPDYQDGLAVSHNRLGNLQQDLGNGSAARASYRKALDIREQLVKEHPDVPAFRSNLAWSQNNLGFLQHNSGDLAGAREWYREALDIRERLAREHPDVPEYQNSLAASHNNMGNLQKDSRNNAGAQELFRKAISIREQLVQDHPDVPEYQSSLALNHLDLGALAEQTGDLPGARASFKRAVELYGRLAREHAERLAYVRKWADAESLLAWVELLDRKPKAVIAAATQALEIDPKQTGIKAKLAHGLLFDGQYGKALTLYTENKDATLDSGQTFAQTVVNDFRQLRAKGLARPDMPKIEKLMRNAVPRTP